MLPVRWSRRLMLLVAPVVAGLGIGLSLLLWQSLRSAQDENFQNLLDNRLQSYTRLVSTRADTTKSTLERMGKRWAVLQRTPRLVWANDAKSIMADVPILEEIRWVDSDLVQRWSVTPQREDWALNVPLDDQVMVDNAISRTQPDPKARIAGLESRPDGTFYADIFVPLWVNNSFDGLIVAKLNISQLLYTTYDDAEVVSALDVYHNGAAIFARQRTAPVPGIDLIATRELQLDAVTLNATLRPTPIFFERSGSQWPLLVLYGSLIVAVLMAILVHQWLKIKVSNLTLLHTQNALVGSKEALRENRVHLETMYDTAPFGVCVFDLNLRYVSINERLAKFNGASVENHLGRTPREVRASVADKIEPILKYVLSSGMAVENLEGQAADMDGSGHIRSWLSSYHPARDDKGQMIGIVASILDITGLKEAESEKEKLVEQLHQSQKTEALGRLTGGIAHDFNNMLGVILGTLEFVADKVTDEKLSPLLVRIRQAAERAGDLTQRLLAFARQQPLNPRTVDVAQLISNLTQLLVRSLGEAIDIRCIMAPDLWTAEVDPSQLESALLNLAINARDAMPSGGKLTIEACNTTIDDTYVENNIDAEPGQYVMVSVSDSGTGMSPAVIAKAFEPFFTTKEVGKGSGLGLSMVQGFMKQSQGHVQIYSELGQGTTVKLYIPRAADEAQLPESTVAAPLERGQETIFVVEDDEMMRETAVLLLESLGYTVIVANSGVEALPIVESDRHIDLLFTDIVMPGGIDGAALAERARLHRPGFKIVFSSGYTDNAITHQGRLPPGIHLVQKPYRRAELAKKIREVLDAP